MALDAHEAARARVRVARPPGPLEHIETIDPADYPRFKALGVIASMQPLHANPDQNNADVWSRNLGPDRARPRLLLGQHPARRRAPRLRQRLAGGDLERAGAGCSAR